MNYELIERLTASKSKTMKKISAAVCMLIIASIMVVGSTYAWVVLSTAPEVSEITTTVGSNGALEIRLNIDDDTDRNSMFRNIVDFSNAKYGLDKITLLPSISAPSANLGSEVLQIPKYGDDGLAMGSGISGKTFLGSLSSDGNFYKSDATGVRVVGSASGMTDRQVRFDTAIAAARSALSAAKSNATTSLKNDAFVGIVIKMMTNGDGGYAEEDVAALGTIIDKLEASVAQMQEAYKQLIIAAAASDNGQEDIVSTLVASNWGSAELTLDAIATTGKISIQGYSVDAPADILAGIRALQATAENVAGARASYSALNGDYTADKVNPIITKLVDKNNVLVNGKAPSEVEYNDIILNGAIIAMTPGAGVYVEIADQCGDYSAQITNTISMKTASGVSSKYISTAITALENKGAPGGDVAELPMTSLYGYIIDLGFKTNAKDSNLLLQTEATDRVNQSSSDLEAGTMGGGSYMSFTVTEDADIGKDQVVQIMKCFRIVFFDTNSGNVIGTASLDTANAVFNAEGEVVAKIYMENSDQVITPLTQNTERNLSVLVYLDAENLMNENLSATTATSVTGVMNLQFASDADLIPVYGDQNLNNDQPDGLEELEFTLNDDGISYSVTGIGTYKDANVIIPSTYKGLPVTSIGERAFYNCDGITGIEIPDSVTSIESSAFYYCDGITDVEIPDSVTSIGSSAFYQCSNLTNVAIPDSVTSIGSSAFYQCSNLTSVAIPDSVTSMGDYVFYGCSSLTSVVIPDSVTSIGNYAFSYCRNLTSVTIPEDITSIGSHAFASSGLTGIDLPNSVTYIGQSAFAACNNLTSIVIPDGVTRIYGSTFEGCDNLTSIEIPGSVTSIDSAAFEGCYNLTSIEIPDSVTSIGSRAFYGCSDLESIEFAENSTLTSIGAYAFIGCDSLTEIVIPDSMTSIGDKAFYECTGLTRVVIPDSVTNIYSQAFYNCRNLTTVQFAENSKLKSIGSYAFDYCTSLTAIEIPDSVTNIDHEAFRGCSSLESVVIGDGLTSIESSVFYDCTGITSIKVSANNPNYKDIDGNLYTKDEKTLIQYALGKKDSSFTVPSGVTNISSGAFRNCTNLTSVVIPDGVTSIDSSAFSYCSNLTSVVIPDSVTSIGYGAFQYCESLTSIYYRGTEEQWNNISKGLYWNSNTGNYTITYNYDGE